MEGTPTDEETHHERPKDGPTSLSPRRHFKEIMAGVKKELFMPAILLIQFAFIVNGFWGLLIALLLIDFVSSNAEVYVPAFLFYVICLGSFIVMFIIGAKLFFPEKSFGLLSFICDVEPRYKLAFPTYSDEKLMDYFDCYCLFMSTCSTTDHQPLPGILYLSDSHLAFCCDLPLPVTLPAPGQIWTYYKVMVRLANISTVKTVIKGKGVLDKYVQITTIQGLEFWFMGFEDYAKASTQLGGIISKFSAPRLSLTIHEE